MIKLIQGSTDYTADLNRALDSPVIFDVASGSLTIEVKCLKKLTQLFFDVQSEHDCDTIAVTAWNGTSFVAISDHEDDSNILTRAGFIRWSNPSDLALDSSFYRYRFTISGGSVSANPVNVTFRYIGIVFCEMHDLKGEMPDASDFKPDADHSLIRFIVAAKKDIVQRFRNGGNNVFDVAPRDLTEFDFNEPSQLRQASTYLALSKLCFYRSDAVDDKWSDRSKDYNDKYGKAVQLFFISLDTNGDGVKDATTKEFSVNTGVLNRE